MERVAALLLVVVVLLGIVIAGVVDRSRWDETTAFICGQISALHGKLSAECEVYHKWAVAAGDKDD